MIATREEELSVRGKFYDAARKMYPDVGEPGTVWVCTQVLGWSWEDVQATAVEGFSRDGYRRFVLTEDGKRQQGDTPFTVKSVTRKWTKEEKRLLKDWWWLLGY